MNENKILKFKKKLTVLMISKTLTAHYTSLIEKIMNKQTKTRITRHFQQPASHRQQHAITGHPTRRRIEEFSSAEHYHRNRELRQSLHHHSQTPWRCASGEKQTQRWTHKWAQNKCRGWTRKRWWYLSECMTCNIVCHMSMTVDGGDIGSGRNCCRRTIPLVK